MIKKTFLLISILSSFFLTSSVSAIELKGEVIEVNGLDVKIRLDSDIQPRINDSVDVKFTIPGGEMLSIGAWKVNRVEKDIVYARVLNNTGVPQEGQKAIIYSSSPIVSGNLGYGSPKKMIKQKPKEKIHKEYIIEGEVVDVTREKITIKLTSNHLVHMGDKVALYKIKTKKKARKDIPEEILVLIEKVQNESPAEKRKAIRLIVKSSHKNNLDLLEAVKEDLLKGYLSNYRNSLHVDNMSWLCNILGDSRNKKYRDILEHVYREAKHKKLKKYAYKNFRRLR